MKRSKKLGKFLANHLLHLYNDRHKNLHYSVVDKLLCFEFKINDLQVAR